MKNENIMKFVIQIFYQKYHKIKKYYIKNHLILIT